MINAPPLLANPREVLGSAVPRALRDRIWKGGDAIRESDPFGQTN